MTEDEVQLVEIFRVLARRKAWLFGVPLAAMVCALIAVLLLPQEWEALAVVRIGHTGQAQGDRLIEPVASSIERLQLRPFQDEILKALAQPVDGSGGKLYRRSITVTAVPGADDLVRIKVRGYTTGEARQLAQSNTDALIAIHRGMQQPAIDLMRSQLDQILGALQEASSIRSELGHNAVARNTEATAADALQINVVQSAMNTELNALRQIKLNVSERLSPVHTFPTALLDEVSVSDRAVFPNRLLIFALAGIVGLVLGILAALIRDYVFRALTEQSPALVGSR
ncbi:Wzz/FepE/Etk N-terminal domain-containing protein [Bradyrhizobium ganzhouense]|uniref:Wzz/FepE/Etk N-terminal domain-containing protein n=1 Tax=Bradyrhizobium ganzhouense TaxID=1179767 RepID=UPI003CF0C340